MPSNPVDWYPWGPEAFERARREDKPIFLCVGYSACHWCHVMEHESFEDEATAALMNERFVSIKVDREERPDVDAIYMDAVQALTGRGGWPMSVFLTPDAVPFYGGTYFPPTSRYGMPSFTDVLNQIATLWATAATNSSKPALSCGPRSRRRRRPAPARHPARWSPRRSPRRSPRSPATSTPLSAAGVGRPSSRSHPSSTSCCAATSPPATRTCSRWRR